MKTILVTGGCGFIGSHFVRLMLEKPEWRVINLDKLTYAGNLENLKGTLEGDRYRFVRGDIGDRTLLDELYARERPTAVVNFAAESHVDRSILDPAPCFETNTLGVQVLLEGARNHGVERFMQVSTDEVYGDMDKGEPCDEEHCLAPSSPYAASKAAADHLALSYQRTYQLPTIVTRCSNNFGPYQYPEKVIPLFVSNLLNDKKVPLYGDGLNVRDWIHVDDHAEAILTVLFSGGVGEIYNISAENELSNLELTRLLIAQCDRDESCIEFVKDRPGHDRRYAVDPSKINRELNWRASRSDWPDALTETVKWYCDHQQWCENIRQKYKLR